MDVTRQGPDSASLAEPTDPSAPPERGSAPSGDARALAVALAALRVGPAGILIVLVVALALLSDVFFSLENIGNVLKQSAVICVLALGQLLGHPDSRDRPLGRLQPLPQRSRRRDRVAGPTVRRTRPWARPSLTATCVGLINGLLYVKGRLPHPFIPTLAMLSAASGLALYLSQSETIQGAPPIVDEIGAGRISAIPGGGSVGWFPVAALVVVVVALVLTLVPAARVGPLDLRRRRQPGGGGAQRHPRPAVLISVYVLCGCWPGVAALLTMGKGDAGSPTPGALAELDAIAAVIIGGASFLGGRGNVLNALTGALVIARHAQRAEPARHRPQLAVHRDRRGHRGGRRARRHPGAPREPVPQPAGGERP